LYNQILHREAKTNNSVVGSLLFIFVGFCKMKTDYNTITFHNLPPYVKNIIVTILDREGSVFTNHPNDWPTKYGVRKLSADRAGYCGKIEDLSYDEAARIWTSLFWFGPNLHLVGEVCPLIAETVVDTSGPAGLRVGISHLQEALTSFNIIKDGQGIYGTDLIPDGIIGNKTLDQLKLYIEHREKQDGVRKLAARLNCLQDAHYTYLAIRLPKKRVFSFGWSSGRVFADLMELAETTDDE
jgi:hypothetical protein